MPKVGAQKGCKKHVILMVFRVRLFLAIQGPRSRGLGQFCQESPGAGKGVLEDTFSHPGTPYIWVFPATFPSKG